MQRCSSPEPELKAKGTRVVAVLPVQTDTKLATQMPDPKVKPSEVAVETLDALDAGLDEVFPGEPTKIAAQRFKADPAAVQAMLAQRTHSLA